MAWFEAEHRVLLAVIALAVRAGFDTHACQRFAPSLPFLSIRDPWSIAKLVF